MQIEKAQHQVTMTSLELVDFINEQRTTGEPALRHDNFMAKVPQVLGASRAPEFLGTQTYGNNNTRAIYNFPKREACLMAMSYSYELQAKVFDRMTELEAGQAPMVPKSMAQALRLAAEQAEILEQQQAQLALAAPKVEFVDRFVDATGLHSFRQVAKLLKANEARFREFLIERRIAYYLGQRLTPHQNHIGVGRFEIRTGVARHNDHAYTSAKFTAKGLEWIAGEWAKHQLAQRTEVCA